MFVEKEYEIRELLDILGMQISKMKKSEARKINTLLAAYLQRYKY